MALHGNSARKLIAIACAGLTLSGCAQLGAMSRVDPVSVAVYPGGRNAEDDQLNAGSGGICRLIEGVNSFARGAIDLNCFVFPEDLASNPRRLAYVRAVSNEVDRNRLTALLLKHSDDVCIVEMGRLTANEATVNTSLSILTTGLTAIANIVTGEQASQILTGAANIASGSRDHINAHIYRNQFAYAISKVIRIEREEQRGEIERRYSERVSQFTVDDAIRAANRYHGVCSFYRGLELVLEAVDNQENLERYQTSINRQAEIDRINREIAQLTAEMRNAPSDERAPYRTQIEALLARRAELTRNEESPPPPDPAPGTGSGNAAGAAAGTTPGTGAGDGTGSGGAAGTETGGGTAAGTATGTGTGTGTEEDP